MRQRNQPRSAARSPLGMAPPVPPTPPSRGRPKLSQHRKTKIAIAFVCTFFVAMLTMFPYFAYWLLLKPRAHVTIGAVDRATPAVEQYFAANATLELLHDDFVWAEGPLYVRPDPAQPKADYVLASDVRSNQMLKVGAAAAAEHAGMCSRCRRHPCTRSGKAASPWPCTRRAMRAQQRT